MVYLLEQLDFLAFRKRTASGSKQCLFDFRTSNANRIWPYKGWVICPITK